MKGTEDWLSQLKLRASWGQNGSLAALSGYAYSTDMALGGLYPFVMGEFVHYQCCSFHNGQR